MSAEQQEVYGPPPPPVKDPEKYLPKKTRLERLKCWPTVKEMLLDNEPVTRCVRYIQEDCGEYTDVKPETVRHAIYHWLNKKGAAELKASRVPTRYLTMLNEIEGQVDPLDAVNMLFAIQVDRVMLEYGNELRTRKTSQVNNGNIRLANDMARTMSHLMLDKYRHRAYKNQTDGGNKGANDTLAAVEKMKERLAERFGDKAAAVALNPEGRRRVYNALQRVRKGNTEPMLKLLKNNQEILEKNGRVAREPKKEDG